jgi:hypothetical protein
MYNRRRGSQERFEKITSTGGHGLLDRWAVAEWLIGWPIDQFEGNMPIE